jgi:rRNA maturation endonuclease Nob1
MDQNKICPACGAECNPHIDNCADCGAVLLAFEKHLRAGEAEEMPAQTSMENKDVVLAGDLDWIRELHAVLMASGIAGSVESERAGRNGRLRSGCRLVVSPDDLERARKRIEEHLMEINPDLLISQELFGKNKCPACGAIFVRDARECADCGLPLVVIEEDN